MRLPGSFLPVFFGFFLLRPSYSFPFFSHSTDWNCLTDFFPTDWNCLTGFFLTDWTVRTVFSLLAGLFLLPFSCGLDFSY
jgi:hypothetical protein